MRISAAYILMFQSALMLLAATARSQNPAGFSPLSWNELKPATLAADTMQVDKAGGTPIEDADGKGLLFTGTSFLWRWNIEDGSVSRVSLPAGRSGSSSPVAAGKHHVVIVDQESAWVFARNSKTWKKLDGSFDPGCAPSVAGGIPGNDSHRVYIATDCGVYLALLESGQLIRAVGDDFVLALREVPAMAEIGPGTVLIPEGLDLTRMTLDGPRARKNSLYTAKSKILGVARVDDQTIAWTSQALIFFNRDMRRVQVVPVLGRRKIRTFAAGREFHFVLFTDGSLEVMGLASRQRWSGRDFDGSSLVIAKSGKYVFMSAQKGLPRVFSLVNFR
jgi:hypothetical protein